MAPNQTEHDGGSQEHKHITVDLCKFIAAADFNMLGEKQTAKLKELIIDHIGIAAGAAANSESSGAFLNAVVALGGHNGSSTVYTKGQNFSPQHAAFLNAAYAHTFDFDDTHAASILHPGATAIPAALAQAELAGSDGRDLLLATAVAYEVTTRIGRALGFGAYPRGFHNTATAGIFGAVAAIAKIKRLPAAQIEAAFGLAASQAAGSMQFLANGSWNKRLHPGFAVHNAFVAVALAEAGVTGSAEPLEGRYGLLHSYSTTSTTDSLTDGLGTEWIFTATAVKPFPACRMTHSAIEVVASVAEESSSDKLVESITVELSPTCFLLVGPPDPNKVHPRTIVDGQFSMYYQVAIAWLYGMDIGWAMYEKLTDPDVSRLCDKVRVVVNEEVRDLEARVVFQFADGVTRKEGRVHPLGEDEHPFAIERVRGKFLRMTTPCYDEKTQQAILHVVEHLEASNAADLLKLL